MYKIKKVLVVGAGVMGHGIAQIFSQYYKCDVYLLDIKEEFLERGINHIKNNLEKLVDRGELEEDEKDNILHRIRPTTDIKEAYKDVDLMIEAVIEKINVKKSIFETADKLTPPDAILATNTSSFSITQIASFTQRPEKVVGMHFFNPAPILKLVEIVRGAKTSDETVEIVKEICKVIGKEPVICKKDSPGFIVNRILFPALNEAANLVEEDIADPRDIDKAVKLGLNWPMGPIELLDLIGIDTAVEILNSLSQGLNKSKYKPSPLLVKMAKVGDLGRKTKKGFYKY
ncbi:3-hydroxybutyryl-CoA dehydrogenase [Thermococci archaeon]|nr:MAG: 3-hydroxybutyryl-CoA dehydrogenase [Thermococci archaeon]